MGNGSRITLNGPLTSPPPPPTPLLPPNSTQNRYFPPIDLRIVIHWAAHCSKDPLPLALCYSWDVWSWFYRHMHIKMSDGVFEGPSKRSRYKDIKRLKFQTRKLNLTIALFWMRFAVKCLRQNVLLWMIDDSLEHLNKVRKWSNTLMNYQNCVVFVKFN